MTQNSWVTDVIADVRRIDVVPGIDFYAPSKDGIDLFGFDHISLQASLRGGVGLVGIGQVDRQVSVNFEASIDGNSWFCIDSLGILSTTGGPAPAGLLTIGFDVWDVALHFNNIHFKFFRAHIVWDGETSVVEGKALISTLREVPYAYWDGDFENDENTYVKNTAASYCGRCGGTLSQVSSEGLFGEKYTGNRCSKCGWIG